MDFVSFLKKSFIYQYLSERYKEKYWQNKNKHNSVMLKDICNYKNVVVGSHSYGTVDAVFTNNETKLYIGNFCSIAKNVLFITASEHGYNKLSTFPFKVLVAGETKPEAYSKGDVVVKDDVWIGANSIILSGLTINQGAIVAAGSVVTKDVPPYAIVGGNPAKVIKYRFSEPIIQKLLKIDYSKLSDETILNNLDTMYEEITEENVNNIVNKLIKNTKTVEVTDAF